MCLLEARILLLPPRGIFKTTFDVIWFLICIIMRIAMKDSCFDTSMEISYYFLQKMRCGLIHETRLVVQIEIMLCLYCDLAM
jgi:hypothetical protein